MSNKQMKKNKTGLRGTVHIPGDKSISHRAVMFGSLAKGTTEITNFLQGADCLSTIHCFRELGISIDNLGETILVHGQGLHGLKAPSCILDTGNSGTTTRLISGILAGQNFSCTLSGDDSLNSRPMKRIIDPLCSMGAHISSIAGNGCAPLSITGSSLHGIQYMSPVASAQIKSAILLAGLYADSETAVIEPFLSRNHTELLLSGFGAGITSDTAGNGQAKTSIKPCRELYPQSIAVPGDISSAAYFIAAGLLLEGSELFLPNVGINPTRAGFLKVCSNMGANISITNLSTSAGEPTADLMVTPQSLHGTVIEGSLIPALIDEIPIIAVMAAFAKGTTVIRDAAELAIKETNRIDTITKNLLAMGVTAIPTPDGMIIEGGKPVHGAVLESFLDHRIAMSFAVAGLAAEGTTLIGNSQCADISYPGFFHVIEALQR